jgi:para-aminobenzoate synthetase/4-amino-4-deoxychorismate lyase
MDKIKPQSGFVKQTEILLRDQNEWLYLSKPYEIITTEKLEEVLPALQEIERLIAANKWYAAGFLSYEAAPAFDSAIQTQPEDGFPYLWFGLYPEPRIITLPRPEAQKQILDWQPTTDLEQYHAAIAKIKNYIATGKTYQVNYTMRLQADFIGSEWDFFLHLAQSQNSHAAYIDTGRYVVCSASPELFFRLDRNTITCRPMKGTAKHGRTTIEDNEQSNWLKNSKKNRAENVMIVDMIRNDLGKIAQIGSVQVPHLFDVERYSTLWQMTSTVAARTNALLPEIFTALFPCGSITGAPKVSTMKIIAELENTPRKIYTGTIGYFSPERQASFNVAIRTLLIDREGYKAEYGIGGGVVWDSSSTDEYAEALLKAQVLVKQQPAFSLLETMLWTPAKGFYLQEKHVARMLDSAAYFDIPITIEKLERYLERISSVLLPQRVLLLDQTGNLNYQSSRFEIAESKQSLTVCLQKNQLTAVMCFSSTRRRSAMPMNLRGEAWKHSTTFCCTTNGAN